MIRRPLYRRERVKVVVVEELEVDNDLISRKHCLSIANSQTCLLSFCDIPRSPKPNLELVITHAQRLVLVDLQVRTAGVIDKSSVIAPQALHRWRVM